MKKVLLLVLSMVLVFGIVGCSKPTILANCEVCGQRKQCYDVTWHMINEKTKKETHTVCSKDCEKYLDQLMTLGGAVKE